MCIRDSLKPGAQRRRIGVGTLVYELLNRFAFLAETFREPALGRFPSAVQFASVGIACTASEFASPGKIETEIAQVVVDAGERELPAVRSALVARTLAHDVECSVAVELEQPLRVANIEPVSYTHLLGRRKHLNVDAQEGTPRARFDGDDASVPGAGHRARGCAQLQAHAIADTQQERVGGSEFGAHADRTRVRRHAHPPFGALGDVDFRHYDECRRQANHHRGDQQYCPRPRREGVQQRAAFAITEMMREGFFAERS